MKKQKEAGEKAYLCPKCRSRNVKKVISLRTFFGLFSRWKCNSCKHEEIVFPLVETKRAKAEKKKVKKTKERKSK